MTTLSLAPATPLQPRVTVVIVNYRTDAYVARSLAALAGERATGIDFDVVLVDGGSGDGSAERLRALITDRAYSGWVSLLALSLNGGFGWANNQAILRILQSERPPEFIYLLNPDTVIEPGAISALLNLLRDRPRAGAVGSQLLEVDGHSAGSAFRFPTVAREFARGMATDKLSRLMGIAPQLIEPQSDCQADWVTGASVMLRSAALREVGLFDSGFFLYFEELELMFRMRRAGWQVWHAHDSRVMHIGGVSTGVGAHATESRSPYPAYWFRSRRRFFALAYGAGATRRANLAWLTGHLVWKVRCLFEPRVTANGVPGEWRGLLDHGIAPSHNDLTPAYSTWSDQPGIAPAWMTGQ